MTDLACPHPFVRWPTSAESYDLSEPSLPLHRRNGPPYPILGRVCAVAYADYLDEPLSS
jgi:hypothetical protein